jgi:outer membrane receptor for ferrienterochelin and colicins
MAKYILGRIALLFLFISLNNTVFAQVKPAGNKTIYGIVTNEKDELLVGASVYWKDRKSGVTTDAEGSFHIAARNKPDSLFVQYVGYQLSAVEVLPGEDSLWVVITEMTTLKAVEITAHGFGNAVSTLDSRNLESISSKELRKAPCCNLSESFETNGSVDVSYPNAITGVKEIQLLGLRGIYSQFLVENRPTMTGIATPFAFEMIPGTWLSGIVLAKGASTVKNGNNGFTGQINADLQKPLQDKPLFINLFTSSEGRGEANVHLNKKHGTTSADGLYLHGSFVKNKWDMNDDNFYDMPNRQQLNAMYRHQYDGPKGCFQINAQALTDSRLSGQIRPLEGQNRSFEVNQRNDRGEIWAKYGKEGIGGKAYQQIGNMASASWHQTNSAFGPNIWQANQMSIYWQSLFQSIIGTTDHKYVIAPSVQYDVIAEKVNEKILDRKELVPGAMMEYTYNRPNLELGIPDLTLVLGARMDYNTRFDRLMFTPRMSAKYNFTTETVARLSAGRGFRSPNLMAENISLLASNRAFQFASDLQLEEAWNYGVNFTHNFKIARKNGSFAVDLYRTDFVQQILVDVDQSPLAVYFYNVDGPSFSNSAMAVLQYNFFGGFEAKVVGKWQDVRTTYSDGVLRRAPLTPQFRGLATVDYTTPNKKWSINLRTQVVGPQRLPDNSQVPHELIHGFPAESPVYVILSGQITRVLSPEMELYFGGENLTNYQQHAAIIAANDPSSAYFNGSQLWAPMSGIVVSLGFRYTKG